MFSWLTLQGGRQEGRLRGRRVSHPELRPLGCPPRPVQRSQCTSVARLAAERFREPTVLNAESRSFALARSEGGTTESRSGFAERGFARAARCGTSRSSFVPGRLTAPGDVFPPSARVPPGRPR